MVTDTGTTRPTSVSVAAEAVAVTVNSAAVVGSAVEQMRGVVQVHQAQQTLDDREAVSVTAEPIAANTAGQQRPTSASGTTREAGRQRRAERGGDAGVVGDLLRDPSRR